MAKTIFSVFSLIVSYSIYFSCDSPPVEVTSSPIVLSGVAAILSLAAVLHLIIHKDAVDRRLTGAIIFFSLVIIFRCIFDVAWFDYNSPLGWCLSVPIAFGLQFGVREIFA